MRKRVWNAAGFQHPPRSTCVEVEEATAEASVDCWTVCAGLMVVGRAVSGTKGICSGCRLGRAGAVAARGRICGVLDVNRVLDVDVLNCLDFSPYPDTVSISPAGTCGGRGGGAGVW